MTTSVFIRNDSPLSSGHNVFVGVNYRSDDKLVHASTERPLAPGEHVITTVYQGMQLVVRESEE